MPVPDFSPGEVLTAAAMDSIGLWKIKEQALSGNSITITGAFSAAYNNYRIIIDDGAASAGANILLRMGTNATNYYWSLVYGAYTGGAATVLAGANVTYWEFAGYAQNRIMMDCHVYSPFLSQNTHVSAPLAQGVGGVGGNMNGLLNNTTSYTSFTLLLSGVATFTSGTVKVYGIKP